jgi:hypothetical protein
MDGGLVHPSDGSGSTLRAVSHSPVFHSRAVHPPPVLHRSLDPRAVAFADRNLLNLALRSPAGRFGGPFQLRPGPLRTAADPV